MFLKGGFNFGEDGVQRLQASYSKFKIEGKGEYIQVMAAAADRRHLADAAHQHFRERGQMFGSKDEFNDFEQYQLEYTHDDFFGGTLVLERVQGRPGDALSARKRRRQAADPGAAASAGLRAIYDQSEIDSKKNGAAHFLDAHDPVQHRRPGTARRRRRGRGRGGSRGWR